MTVGSLFAGIGGFELAAQWAGLTPVWSNEIDPFCCKVLRKNFKHRIIEDDIRNIGAHNLEPVDILTGGFPCQPFSQSGKRKGTADNRYLWPEMLRVIGEVQPAYIVGENVYGLVNWSEGLVFEKVQIDLEDKGYQVAPVILPACGVNAPHKRNRVWFVAYSNVARQRRHERKEEIKTNVITYSCCVNSNLPIFEWRQDTAKNIDFNWPIESGYASNAYCKRLQRCSLIGSTESIWKDSGKQFTRHIRTDWQNFPTQSPLCRRNDGIPDRLDRLKGLGNAIVPQVAYEIFKAIIEAENPRN